MFLLNGNALHIAQTKFREINECDINDPIDHRIVIIWDAVIGASGVTFIVVTDGLACVSTRISCWKRRVVAGAHSSNPDTGKPRKKYMQQLCGTENIPRIQLSYQIAYNLQATVALAV